MSQTREAIEVTAAHTSIVLRRLLASPNPPNPDLGTR